VCNEEEEEEDDDELRTGVNNNTKEAQYSSGY